jgi:odorant receptor
MVMDALVHFSDFVDFPSKCLMVIGLALDDTGETKWNKYRKIYHNVFKASLLMTFLLLTMFMKEKIDDLVLITELAPSPGTAILALIKIVTLSNATKAFQELKGTLEDLFPKTKEDQQKYGVRQYLNSYKMFERTSAASVFSVVLVFIISGVCWGKLPFLNWYPFEENGKLFYFTFVWQLCSSLATICSLVGPDLMLFTFITLISLQFNILYVRLTELKVLPVDEAEKMLIELIKLHNTLLRMTVNLEKIFSISILFNLLYSSVLICLMEFQVVEVAKNDIFLKFLLFLVVSLNGIFQLCRFGEKLTTASNNITDAVYDLEWYEKKNFKLRSSILMLMRQSQRQNCISAGKFFAVSLEAYTTVK